MSRFNVGDKVKVPKEMHGVPLEWLGKEATVIAVPGQSASGTVPSGVRPSLAWQPMYEVQFDGTTDTVLVDEDKLVPAEDSS